MTTPLIFLAKSIGLSVRGGRKPVSLLQALRHNLRHSYNDRGCGANINPALTPDNLVLAGSIDPKAVCANASAIKADYAVPKRKLRKDHVQALEFIVSLPVHSNVESHPFFADALTWFNEVFGTEMVLSAVVHYDEAAPHMHVLVLPIVDGCYEGGAPIDMRHLPDLIKRFAKEVGRRFGLRLKPRARFMSGEKNMMVDMVLKYLQENSDSILCSQLWPPVRAEITRSPQSYFGMLGLALPEQKAPKRMRTFTQIMTGTGRRTAEDRCLGGGLVLPCVGFGN
jgi:hypothetical protein